jgi:hypothetical protein
VYDKYLPFFYSIGSQGCVDVKGRLVPGRYTLQNNALIRQGLAKDDLFPVYHSVLANLFGVVYACIVFLLYLAWVETFPSTLPILNFSIPCLLDTNVGCSLEHETLDCTMNYEFSVFTSVAAVLSMKGMIIFWIIQVYGCLDNLILFMPMCSWCHSLKTQNCYHFFKFLFKNWNKTPSAIVCFSICSKSYIWIFISWRVW